MHTHNNGEIVNYLSSGVYMHKIVSIKIKENDS